MLHFGLNLVFQVHHLAGRLPAIFFGEIAMKELSIFVDESGDFGPYSNHSPFYLFSLVLHEQSNSIEEAVNELDKRIKEHGFDVHAIHSGPIIRNEGFYKSYDSEDRKRLFNDLLFFTKRVNIQYNIVSVDKKQTSGRRELVERLSKQLALFVREKLEYFSSFDKVIVYYDYGQSEITTILTSVLNSLLANVDFRHVQPYQYKLFQVADMICTLELSKMKYDSNKISTSEENFYESRRKFRDFYYKTIKKKRI